MLNCNSFSFGLEHGFEAASLGEDANIGKRWYFANFSRQLQIDLYVVVRAPWVSAQRLMWAFGDIHLMC